MWLTVNVQCDTILTFIARIAVPFVCRLCLTCDPTYLLEICFVQSTKLSAQSVPPRQLQFLITPAPASAPA
eukprot:m.380784 g.380784  ORF g.380784 m.380784 type:complete len:71 (+) comp108926_c0_seq1:32-244(+)